MKKKFIATYIITHKNKPWKARITVVAHHKDEVVGKVYDYEEKTRDGSFEIKNLEVKEEFDVVDMFKNIFGIKI